VSNFFLEKRNARQYFILSTRLGQETKDGAVAGGGSEKRNSELGKRKVPIMELKEKGTLKRYDAVARRPVKEKKKVKEEPSAGGAAEVWHPWRKARNRSSKSTRKL